MFYGTGEDGKPGLHGILKEKQGAMIGRAMLAGIFSGLGSAVGQTYQNVSTSPLGTVSSVNNEDIFKYAGAQGVENAANKVAEWYLKRADEVFPIIEVEAGRVVTVTITADIDLGADLFALGATSP